MTIQGPYKGIKRLEMGKIYEEVSLKRGSIFSLPQRECSEGALNFTSSLQETGFKETILKVGRSLGLECGQQWALDTSLGGKAKRERDVLCWMKLSFSNAESKVHEAQRKYVGPAVKFCLRGLLLKGEGKFSRESG